MSVLLAFFMKPKNIAYLLLAALLAYGGFKLYGVVHARGAAAQLKIDTPLILAANNERDQAKLDLKSYKDQYDKWVATTALDRAAETAKQQQALAKAQADLNQANLSLARKETTLHELRTTVAQELGNLRLPGSVVRLWNESLEGRPADASALGTALAGSTLAADNATTDVTLFDLLEAGLWNNAQGVQRGVMLEQWRRYYFQNKAAFEAHEAKVTAGAPR